MFQTNQLVIVGGPSSVGKSSLLTKMRQGDLPNLCDQLCINLPFSHLYLHARELPHIRQSFIEQLVLHYDFLQQYSQRGGFAYLSDLISRSCNVDVLTLYTSPGVLLQRISARFTKVSTSFLLEPKPNKANKLARLRKKRELYRCPSNLFTLYEEWLVFIEKSGVAKHLIMDTTNSDVMTAIPYERTEIERVLK